MNKKESPTRFNRRCWTSEALRLYVPPTRKKHHTRLGVGQNETTRNWTGSSLHKEMTKTKGYSDCGSKSPLNRKGVPTTTTPTAPPKAHLAPLAPEAAGALFAEERPRAAAGAGQVPCGGGGGRAGGRGGGDGHGPAAGCRREAAEGRDGSVSKRVGFNFKG